MSIIRRRFRRALSSESRRGHLRTGGGAHNPPATFTKPRRIMRSSARHDFSERTRQCDVHLPRERKAMTSRSVSRRLTPGGRNHCHEPCVSRDYSTRCSELVFAVVGRMFRAALRANPWAAPVFNRSKRAMSAPVRIPGNVDALPDLRARVCGSRLYLRHYLPQR